MLKRLVPVGLALMLVFGLCGYAAAAFTMNVIQDGLVNVAVLAQYADNQDCDVTLLQADAATEKSFVNFACVLQQSDGAAISLTSTQVGDDNRLIAGQGDQDSFMINMDMANWFPPTDIGYCWFDKYDHIFPYIWEEVIEATYEGGA